MITNEQMREHILQSISNAQGIKNVDLAMKIMEQIGPHVFEFKQFQDELKNLIFWENVVEVEYMINGKKKSFYLPKETVIMRLGCYV